MAREHLCSEIYEVIDEREGSTICINCGRVLDSQLFLTYEQKKEPNSFFNAQKNSDAKEILFRLNISDNNILQDKNQVEVKDLYQLINEHSAISLKDFCAATGIKKNVAVKTNRNSVCYVDIFILLEKYCSLLEIPFTEHTVIKEKIRNTPYSGHPPLTIIGYFIHTVCKKNKKLTIKRICETLGISSISIQRFKKHEFSRRC